MGVGVRSKLVESNEVVGSSRVTTALCALAGRGRGRVVERREKRGGGGENQRGFYWRWVFLSSCVAESNI